MNKSQLIDATAEKAGLTKADAGAAVDALVETIQNTVASGDSVVIPGFGKFERRARTARTGRNPQTGTEIKIPASKSPAFKAGKAFKDAVNK